MAGFIHDEAASASSLSSREPGFQNAYHKQYGLPVGRYQIQTSTGSIWDMKITCMGVNHALGTTSRRAGIGWTSRGCGGSHGDMQATNPIILFGTGQVFFMETQMHSQMVRLGFA